MGGTAVGVLGAGVMVGGGTAVGGSDVAVGVGGTVVGVGCVGSVTLTVSWATLEPPAPVASTLYTYWPAPGGQSCICAATGACAQIAVASR